MVCEWFGLKTTWTVFAGLTSKPVATVSPCLASKLAVGFLFEPQNQSGGGFPGLCLKICSSIVVIWASKSPRRFLGLVLKTKQASDLSVAPQNRRREVGVGHASRSNSLFAVEASLARVFQSGLKTGGGAMTSGARGTITEVASEAS
jgi:hypothetical protein